MILNSENRVAKSSNLNNDNVINFEIDASPHAFQILTKRLYKDPITAIVRELVSNAIDAHKEAKTEHLPITITPPTNLDPLFIIEDQGTGLSPDKINTVYTIFFKSDRRESNNYFGGFGLGAKTPFAYCDQFTITSYYNNIEYLYIALINKEGTPELHLIHESATKKHNGLKIQIPVLNIDIWKWTDTLKNTLPLIKTNYNINIDLEIPNITPLLQSEKYKILLHNHISSMSAVVANINSILYPIDLSKLNIDRTTYYTRTGLIILNFDIGEIDVIPNKEDLNYNEKTITALVNKYLEVKYDVLQLLIKKVNDCDTYDEACRKYSIIANLLYKWEWANAQTLYHKSNPETRLTSTLPIPNDLYIRSLSWSKKSHCYKIINTRINRINLDSLYQIWYYPKNTSYIKDRVKSIPYAKYTSPPTEVLLLETDNIENINLNTFTHLTTFSDLTKLSFSKSTISKKPKTLKNLHNDIIYTDPYYYIELDVLDRWKENPEWTMNNIDLALKLLDIPLYLVTRTKLSKKEKLNLTDLGTLLQRIPSNLLTIYTKVKHFVTINKDTSNNELSKDIDTINSSHILDLNTKESYFEEFYKKYEPLIENNITNINLIDAFIYYIKRN